MNRIIRPENKFYINQENFHNQIVQEYKKFGENSDPDMIIDKWRHLRMYNHLVPVAGSYKNAKWLTVGDYFGHDSEYLSNMGLNVIPTDISDTFLIKAKRDGAIKNFRKENAEKLSFKDNYFDFVLCKESYHHFPRPIIALYEMLRVAKKGIILIEPNDVNTKGISWKRFWSVDELRNRVNHFEISGNYVYTVSKREIEKVALGIGLPTVAFSGFDDIYVEKIGQEKVGKNSFSFRKTRAFLWFLNILYKFGMRDRSVLVSIIFKEKPGLRLQRKLKDFGYEIKILPKNPYR